MSESIVIAILSLAGTIIGSLLGILAVSYTHLTLPTKA